VLREDGFTHDRRQLQPGDDHDRPRVRRPHVPGAARLEGVAAVLERERPDALLPTMGGQTALNLAMELAERDPRELGVELIGARLGRDQAGRGQELFRETVRSSRAEGAESTIVTSLDEIAEASRFR
jgi:carbamoyl-phosphate synthase large subunit